MTAMHILITSVLLVLASFTPATAADAPSRPAPDVAALAAQAPEQPLPAPSGGGRPLQECLADRRTDRTFAEDRPLDRQQLADLLWAACGINRPESGKRTAPSARNWQEVDVYLTLPEGAFLYWPTTHSLQRVSPRDLRAVAGRQAFCATAPLNLVFVADARRMAGCPDDLRDLYMGADTAFMAQNVYLQCASTGLACVVRGLIDREAIHEALALAPEQRVTLCMTVGHRAADDPPER
ncbi:MAG: nitroreductase family protein [Candidatus Krumholzibacteriia bacterium]